MHRIDLLKHPTSMGKERFTSIRDRGRMRSALPKYGPRSSRPIQRGERLRDCRLREPQRERRGTHASTFNDGEEGTQLAHLYCRAPRVGANATPALSRNHRSSFMDVRTGGC
jgi:hypothetical protein